MGIPEEEIVKIAVKSLGLDDLKPFNTKEKIIEYLLDNNKEKKLIDMTCKGFTNETASESPAPGGGSVPYGDSGRRFDSIPGGSAVIRQGTPKSELLQRTDCAESNVRDRSTKGNES